jgi:hypothetical protein
MFTYQWLILVYRGATRSDICQKLNNKYTSNIYHPYQPGFHRQLKHLN